MREAEMVDEAEGRDVVQGDWKDVDARLRQLAGQSAALDWEIGGALLLARQTRAHERLGYASLFEYVERLFGYSARVTAERLRVADALRDLPELEQALRAGERSWSAIRELTRVATDESDGEWLDYSAGKTVRELEQAVSGLRPGDRPGDPPDPHLMRKIIRVEVSPEGWSLFKDAMARLRREVDERLTEEDAFVELCRRSLGAGADPGAAPYQVALTICDHCARTWQDAGGETMELPPEVGERAMCDAQTLDRDRNLWGSGAVGVAAAPRAADAGASPQGTVVGAPTQVGAATAGLTHVGAGTPEHTHVGAGTPGHTHVGAGTPGHTHVGAGTHGSPDRAAGRQRATRTIPPAVRREVIRRDGARCRAPGCRNHTWLDLHHLTPRSEGGGHDAAGIVVLCGSHHALLHSGFLFIEGTTERDARFTHADGTLYGSAPRPIAVQASAEAFAALRSLGFGETESRQALAIARTPVGADASTEVLVAAALKRPSLAA